MIKVDATELVKGLSFLKEIVPSNPHIQSFKNVLFTQTENGLKMRGMAYGKAGTITIPCESESTVEPFLVPMDEFYRFIVVAKKISKSFTLTVKSNVLNIILEDGSGAELNTVDISFLPDMPSDDYHTNLTVDPVEFVKSMMLSAFTNSPLISLTMLHIFGNGEKVKVEATDGHTGGQIILDDISVEFDTAVPSSISRPLKKALSLGDDQWDVKISDSHISIGGENWLVVYSTLNKDYPNISNIYTNNNTNLLQLDRKEFLLNVQLVGTMSGDDTLSIIIKDGKIGISAKTTGVGGRESFMTVPDDEPENKLFLKLSEVQKILNLLKNDLIFMQTGHNEPVLFFEDVHSIYFTLPLSL